MAVVAKLNAIRQVANATRIPMVSRRRLRPSASPMRPISGLEKTATAPKMTTTVPARTGSMPAPLTISRFDQVMKP